MATIIEIRPEQARVTTRNSEGKSVTESIKAAVSPATANRQLHEYNLPEANSLNPATALKELFPGLKLQHTREVDVILPQDLIKQHRPQPAEGDQLVIHSPGEELRILKVLAENNLLKTFNLLTVQAHEEPMYEHAAAASELMDWLQGQGFECAQRQTDDPDWPTLECTRNPLQNTVDTLKREKAKLQQQLTEQQNQAQAKAQENQQLREELTAQKQAAESLRAEEQKIREQLEATHKTLTKEQAAHKEARQSLEQQASATQAEQKKAESLQHTLNQQKQQLEQAGKEQQRLAEELDAARASLGNSQKARKTAEQRTQELENELAKIRKGSSEREHQLEELRKQLTAEQASHQQTRRVLEDQTSATHAEQKKTESLQQTLNQLKQQLDESAGKAQAAQQQADQAHADNAGLREALAAANRQVQELEAQLQALSQTKADLQARCEQLQQQLDTQADTQKHLKTLQDRMEYLFGQNTLQLEQAANALGQHISHTAQHTARELEAGLALQQLGSDSPPPGKGDNEWPKSATLELARLLKTQRYDLVIEFGSGVTTEFIVHTLKNARNGEPASSDSARLTHYVEASDDDLPKRILSFEHNRARHGKLGEHLKSNGLSAYVNLQFAPLVPFQHRGEEHLYYDCGTRLQQLAQLLDGRSARILVILNQPEDETGADMQVALPALLQHLSAHCLDLIVNRPDQPQLASQWQKLLGERGLEHTGPAPFGVDAVQRITVNP